METRLLPCSAVGLAFGKKFTEEEKLAVGWAWSLTLTCTLTLLFPSLFPCCFHDNNSQIPSSWRRVVWWTWRASVDQKQCERFIASHIPTSETTTISLLLTSLFILLFFSCIVLRMKLSRDWVPISQLRLRPAMTRHTCESFLHILLPLAQDSPVVKNHVH